MATVTLSVPEKLCRASARLGKGGADIQEYLMSALESLAMDGRMIDAKTEAKLLEGLDSPLVKKRNDRLQSKLASFDAAWKAKEGSLMAEYKVREIADLDVDEIADYIAQRNVSAGRKFIEAVFAEFEFLSQHPRAGSRRRVGHKRLDGLRSWPIRGFRKYLIFYLPSIDGVEVLRVLHGARNVEQMIEEM